MLEESEFADADDDASREDMALCSTSQQTGGTSVLPSSKNLATHLVEKEREQSFSAMSSSLELDNCVVAGDIPSESLPTEFVSNNAAEVSMEESASRASSWSNQLQGKDDCNVFGCLVNSQHKHAQCALPPGIAFASSSQLDCSASDCTTTRDTLAHCWYSPKVESSVPSARAAHSCDVIGCSKLYVFGGWNGKKAMNDLHLLDANTMQWTQLRPKNPPPARNNHTTAVVGHRLYIHGGHDGTKWLDDLHVLDTETLTWTELVINGKAPSARACHILSRVNDRLYMFGGYDGTRCFNDIDILDLATMSWIQPKVNGQPPQARNAHTMTVIDSKLFLFGGHSGNKHLTDLHVFDTATLRWYRPVVQGVPPPGLRGHTANLIGDRIFLFGGYDGKGRSNDLYILDAIKLKWLHPQETEYTPAGRQRHSACLVGTKRLLIFGGFDGCKWLNDLHVLDVGRLTEDELVDGAVRILVGNLRKLIGDSQFSDVTLVAEGREVPAHKNILAAQCNYFKSMFCDRMKEASANKVVLSGWTYAALMTVLEYLYTARITETMPDVICDVLGLADICGLNGLKVLCENILKHSVDSHNVCNLLRNADRNQAHELKRFCESFILRHASDVIKTSAFEELAEAPTLMLQLAKLSLSKNCQDPAGCKTSSGVDDGPGGI